MKKLGLVLFLSACVSQQEVRGNLWQHDKVPAEVCEKAPELKVLGIYRVVKCPNVQVHGCENGEESYEEVISFCASRIEDFLSADKVYVEDWLKKATRPK
jgi:hypothetical protein